MKKVVLFALCVCLYVAYFAVCIAGETKVDVYSMTVEERIQSERLIMGF